jgi:hypothetical protein
MTVAEVRASLVDTLNSVDGLTATVGEWRLEQLPHAWITRMTQRAGSFGAATFDYQAVVIVAVSTGAGLEAAHAQLDDLIDPVLAALTGDLGGVVDDCWWTLVDNIGEPVQLAGVECVGFEVTIEILD